MAQEPLTVVAAEDGFARVFAAMRDPSFYSPAPDLVAVRETHVSVVFLAGDRAYKLKKPVRMPFLDYSTLERRRRFCAEEVRLNARFAPDVYLGVRAVADRGGELVLADPEDPLAVEYVVVMRRLDEDATLECVVERGAADTRLAESIGGRVADIHLSAPRAPAGYWSCEYVAERLHENFDTTEPDIGVLVDRLTHDSVQRFSDAFLRTHCDLLDNRTATGMVRDVHGDLRAEHIVLERGGLTIIDCIEFDDRLRRIDVIADLAFLIMDLERLGAPDLAAAVERTYAARTGDPDLRALVPFYACYRAWVRAKVTSLRVAQLPPHDPARTPLEERARQLFGLAQRFAWRARLPLVLVICGVGGSGKSTLSAKLRERSGLPHLSSDQVRKEQAGVPFGDRAPPQAYDAEHTSRAYMELADRAAAAVRSHGGAIVDATFSMRAHRTALTERLQDTGTPILWVECTAPSAVLRRRGGARERGPEHGSDATWPVISAQLETREPLSEIPPASLHALHTDRPVETCLDDVDRFVSAAVDG